ncbi:structural maintenance of chromosomes protein 2-1-like [Cucumis melo var. makuwa]|uniref:Structural maintenance of chromosomes protein 2-1-like n=1 Tax=Cucumis melo var. makuwa TaxID=1194695 RepID=A0A5A7T946_CUCMM|nr:structural maintenance of chromosomes protein 2-1-like [Cucumis melo var. makuwa]
MAISKLAILSLFLALVFTQLRADESLDLEAEHIVEVVRSDDSEFSDLKLELDQLKFKIQKLESDLDVKNQELKRKDEVIAQKEKIISAKLDSISLLESEIASLQVCGSSSLVDDLKRQLEMLNGEKESWETVANEAEKKTLEASLRLESLQKIHEEQKSKIRVTERALEVSKEEMRKAKFEAASKIKELTEVHGAWLPPWLASHYDQFQSLIRTHWNEHAKPAIDVVIQKASDKTAQAAKWAEPHVKTVKIKYIPVVKERWLVVKTNVKPHIETLTAKTVEFYQTSKSVITPYAVKSKEAIRPYYLEVKKFSKPYIDQVATVTKPHVEKVRVVLKPYTKKLVRGYGKFLKSAAVYHHKVQGAVKETLNKHELTKPLATRELEWFAASAILALPIIFLFNMISALFWKKTKKPTRNTVHNARRKGKRAHSDK